MVDPAQGGGGLMEIGCYPIAAAVMALGVEKLQVVAGGYVENGVDLAAGIVISQEGGATAVLSYTLQAQTPEVWSCTPLVLNTLLSRLRHLIVWIRYQETLIVGDKGYIKIHPPAHCPERSLTSAPNQS